MKVLSKIFSFIKKHKELIFLFLFTFVATLLIQMGVITRTSGLITPNRITLIAITMILVVSLNLVVGFLGELSLGHAGFMYIGAYAAGLFIFYTKDLITVALLRFLLAIVVGGVAAMLFGFLIGLPALRLRGDYLAIATLAFGEIVRCIFGRIRIEGFVKNPVDGFGVRSYGSPYLKFLPLISLIFVIVTVFCVKNLIRSKHGRAIVAIRDNEIAARAMGVNITYYKLMVFAIAAFFAGVAGALFTNFQNGLVSYLKFDYNYSIEILVMVVLGGMGSLFGSLISSIVVVILNELLASALTALPTRFAGLKNFIYAIVLIVMMIVMSSPKLAPLREKLSGKNLAAKLKARKKAKSTDKAKELAVHEADEI